MPTCVRKGCGKTFDEATNGQEACSFHPGPPVFHEGLKGWSCCAKRVTDFDSFLKIEGCALGPHSTEAAEPVAAPAPAAAAAPAAEPKPAAAAAPAPAAAAPKPATPAPTATSSSSAAPTTFSNADSPAPVKRNTQPAVPDLPAADPAGAVVAPGTTCLRRGCGVKYESDAVTRATKCVHHPGAPIFHEGSKGWSCCSRKVLEFDEFLKIKGCTTAEHVFVKPAPSTTAAAEQQAQAPAIRRDWYQSREQVIVALYAKKADKAKSRVEFAPRGVRATLAMPDGTTASVEFSTFLPIDPERSTFEVLGTKVEVILHKATSISWPTLEAQDGDVPVSMWTTFGATGSKVGTIGAKEMDYAGDAPIGAAN
ncbi:hypothetical protein H9P43_008094 [Blastocladiella emersonii ATCC 22665]|nr:hypothetical protein H9P43_008094 [Blastocladiella emersonii ATCC 22665]